jgi:hypothetical protein
MSSTNFNQQDLLNSSNLSDSDYACIESVCISVGDENSRPLSNKEKQIASQVGVKLLKLNKKEKKKNAARASAPAACDLMEQMAARDKERDKQMAARDKVRDEEMAARGKVRDEEMAARDKVRDEEMAARDKVRDEEMAARDKVRDEQMERMQRGHTAENSELRGRLVGLEKRVAEDESYLLQRDEESKVLKSQVKKMSRTVSKLDSKVADLKFKSVEQSLSLGNAACELQKFYDLQACLGELFNPVAGRELAGAMLRVAMKLPDKVNIGPDQLNQASISQLESIFKDYKVNPVQLKLMFGCSVERNRVQHSPFLAFGWTGWAGFCEWFNQNKATSIADKLDPAIMPDGIKKMLTIAGVGGEEKDFKCPWCGELVKPKQVKLPASWLCPRPECGKTLPQFDVTVVHG